MEEKVNLRTNWELNRKENKKGHCNIEILKGVNEVEKQIKKNYC